MEETITKDKEEEYESLLSQITHEKKRQFLEQWPIYCVNTDTTKAIGISKDVIYQWTAKDEIFNKAFKLLKKRVDNIRLQRYEAELDKRVLDTPSKQSDILLMFGLKAMHPDKYREKAVSETKLTGNITVKMALPRPGETPLIEVEEPIEITDGTKGRSEEEVSA